MGRTHYDLAITACRERLASLREQAGNGGVLTPGIVRAALWEKCPKGWLKNGLGIDYSNAVDDVIKEWRPAAEKYENTGELF